MTIRAEGRMVIMSLKNLVNSKFSFCHLTPLSLQSSISSQAKFSEESQAVISGYSNLTLKAKTFRSVLPLTFPNSPRSRELLTFCSHSSSPHLNPSHAHNSIPPTPNCLFAPTIILSGLPITEKSRTKLTLGEAQELRARVGATFT